MLSFEHIKLRLLFPRFEKDFGQIEAQKLLSKILGFVQQCESRSLDFTCSNDNFFDKPYCWEELSFIQQWRLFVGSFLRWSVNKGPGSQADLLHGGWGCWYACLPSLNLVFCLKSERVMRPYKILTSHLPFQARKQATHTAKVRKIARHLLVRSRNI